MSMNDFAKTAAALVIAAGLAGAAYMSAPKPVTDAAFSDQGEMFFPAFTDPLAAKSLEVLSYDDATATLTPFKVQFDGARWVIPSHHNYPADAQANMSSAASAFIGLKKDAVRTDKASDHQVLGVLAPDDDKAPLSGRGTRVTLRNAAGETLADLIIGKAVEGGSVGGQVYARVPGKNRVYAVNFTKAITSKFSDWVQTDVLKIGGANVVGFEVDRYQIDEQAGTKVTTETVSIRKAEETTPPAPASPDAPAPTPPRWTFTAQPGGGPKPGETPNEAPIDNAVGALRTMKILGVRPKPEKVVKYFESGGPGGGVKLNSLDLMGMVSKGFFATQDNKFLANEGEVGVTCDDGVVYRMYFGELLVASGEALSAGSDSVGAPGADATKEGSTKEDPKGTEARYMLATVSFDESLLGKAPVAPVAPTAPEGFDAAAPAADGDPQPVKDYRAAKAKYDADQAAYLQAANEHRARVDNGKKRADDLRKSLANWYYVIDAPSFAMLRPKREDLIVKPATAQAAPAAPQGAPAGTPMGEPAPASPAPAAPAPTP